MTCDCVGVDMVWFTSHLRDIVLTSSVPGCHFTTETETDLCLTPTLKTLGHEVIFEVSQCEDGDKMNIVLTC